MKKAKKILVTGGAGFIGSHLVDWLVKTGHPEESIRVLVAPEEKLTNIQQYPKLEIVTGDLRDTTVLSKIIKNCEYVFHLAAKIDFDGKSYEEYEAINVTPTRRLAELAAKEKVKKFIFFSSIGVHGLPAGIGNINGWNEDHAPTYTNWYGQSKWEAEEAVRKVHAKLKLPYCIIRPASVYGPREKGPTLALYKAILHHQFVFIGSGQNKLHYVYVGDIVRAAYTGAFSSLTHGEYIIAGPTPETLENVAEIIARVLDTSLFPLKIPIFIALPLSHLIQLVFSFLGKKAPLYPERVRTMTTTYYYNTSKSERELSFTPVINFKLGAHYTAAWYRHYHWL